MTKPTILLCGPPLLAVGGGPTHLRNMLASPLKDRYRLIHFETGSRGTESPAREEMVLSKLFRLITSPCLLAIQILHARPAIVHLNSALDNKAFWRDAVYLIISKLLGRKVVFQLHGGSLDAMCAKKSTEYLVRLVFSMTDAVVILANSEKRDFQDRGITKGLAVIPNGVDVSQYCSSTGRVHSGKVQRLAYMGRLVREKGLLEAIEAIESLRTEEQFSAIELRIAGSGPAREEIERHINERRLGNSVKLVGPVYGNDKVEFLRAADVFVLPSYQEGLPYSILESLAAGTPVIASNVGGIPDVVVDGIHGILIKPKDPGAIIKAVHTLGLRQDALCVMSKNCIELATRQFGLVALASQFEALYEKVCTDRA